MDAAFNEAVGRAFLFSLAIGVISLLITCWLAYMVLKAAIRDGIKESGLVASWATTVSREASTRPMPLPEMRAD